MRVYFIVDSISRSVIEPKQTGCVTDLQDLPAMIRSWFPEALDIEYNSNPKNKQPYVKWTLNGEDQYWGLEYWEVFEDSERKNFIDEMMEDSLSKLADLQKDIDNMKGIL